MQLDRSTPSLTWPRVRLVVLLAAVCLLAHFNRLSIAVAADARILKQYEITPVQIGWVYSAFLIAYTLAMIPGGLLIDRRGPRFALGLVCLGSAVFVALTGAAGVAASAAMLLAALLVVRTLMGVVSAPLHPAAANAVALGIPAPRRSAANGWITGAALVGVASKDIVFGGLIDRFDWPAAFVIMAVVTVAVGLLWLGYGIERPAHPVVVPADRATPPPSPPPQVRNLALLTASYAAVGYFQYLFFYWIHYYFESVLKMETTASRWYAALPPLAMAVAMPLGGWLSDRLQTRFGWWVARSGLGAASMAASAVLLWLGIQATEPSAIITWLSLALGALGLAEGPFWATAVEVGGNRGGLSAAIFNTGGNAGGILSPYVTPLVSDQWGYGWQAGISLGSIVALAGAACWLAMKPPETTCEPS